jgi:cytoskeletal protein RodZ
MALCAQCAGSLPFGAKFCPACAAPVDDEVDSTPADVVREPKLDPASHQVDTVTDTSGQDTGGSIGAVEGRARKRLLVTALCVVVLVGAGTGVVLANNSAKSRARAKAAAVASASAEASASAAAEASRQAAEDAANQALEDALSGLTDEPPATPSVPLTPPGYPKIVSVSSLPFQVRSWYEGQYSKAVAVAPGVWTPLSPGSTVEDALASDVLDGFCGSIRAYERKYRDGESSAGACW